MTPALLEDFCPWAGEADAHVHLRPDGIGDRVGLPLAGGPLRFERVEIVVRRGGVVERMPAPIDLLENWAGERGIAGAMRDRLAALTAPRAPVRSEEHTSELQSLMRISYAVFCLTQKNN